MVGTVQMGENLVSRLCFALSERAIAAHNAHDHDQEWLICDYAVCAEIREFLEEVRNTGLERELTTARFTLGPNSTDAASGNWCLVCGGSKPTCCRCPDSVSVQLADLPTDEALLIERWAIRVATIAPVTVDIVLPTVRRFRLAGGDEDMFTKLEQHVCRSGNSFIRLLGIVADLIPLGVVK